MKKVALLILLGLLLSQAGGVMAASGGVPPRGIYLQVEELGEAWFIALTTGERFYMKNGNAAYAAMHSFGVGISNADLNKIPVGVLPLNGETDSDGDAIADKLEEALGMNLYDQDSDHDGYPDWTELTYEFNPTGSGGRETKDYALANGLKGHILLQVESRGEAWYVNPADGKRYYMANGDGAYKVMHDLGVGITNADLNKIPLLSQPLNCGTSVDCMLSAVEADVQVNGTVAYWEQDYDLFYEYDVNIQHRLPAGDGLYTDTGDYISARVNGADHFGMIGARTVCKYPDKSAMIAQMINWMNGIVADDDLSFATCEYFYPEVIE